ncbi:hypothetical protein CQW23_15085 [Capsicum baccatum]|uniref:F-box/LRR-repeat protein 15/At3g58940/PEG3-like LRR domain-containing protein n=1 Tax=Capsicum baccatum TaxID=33114 RepID=A0A2G2WL14_CAPBA|nr:hypothetical protein CQW23_15085 [Capsicum baccatum]
MDRLATNNCVKELDFDIKRLEAKEDWYSLPGTVFTAKSLMVLKLRDLKLEWPLIVNHINLSKLKELSLTDVFLEERIILEIYSACSEIEDLRLISLYDELVASVMQSGNLDCASNDVVISYLMNLREKVNPMIINSDVRVLMYMMDVDADGFRPILRINVAKRSIEGLVNSSKPLPPRWVVDDDFSDYENDDDQPINTKNNPMHMEEVSSESQDDEEDREMGSQLGYSFNDRANFYLDQTFADKKELKMLLDTAAVR